MFEFTKITQLICKKDWEGCLSYLEEITQKESTMADQQKFLLSDYSQQKRQIIALIRKQYQQIFNNYPHGMSQEYISSTQETIMKIFSKGLILPELNYCQQIIFLAKIIQDSSNKKYLFMIFQQNLIEIKGLYQSIYPDIMDKVLLKHMFLASSFLNLMGQNIFEDIIEKYRQIYGTFTKISNEQNIINTTNVQVQAFMRQFQEKNILNLQKLLFDGQSKIIKNLKINQKHRKMALDFINILYKNCSSNQSQKRIKQILNYIVCKLELGEEIFTQLPSFWVSDNIESIVKFYHEQFIFDVFGTILINQLPSRPEYFKVEKHLFTLLKWVVEYLYFKKQPISSVSLRENKIFIVSLFQRFSILMGLLNKQKDSQKQLQMMINAVFNKKRLFLNAKISQFLWRQLIQKHEDVNFKIFCIGQYKKVFPFQIKGLNNSCIYVLKNGFQLILKMISQLQANSNPQYIGFHITLVIYVLACLQRVKKYYQKDNQQLKKQRLILNFVFSSQKIHELKQNIKTVLFKLKQSLKDRLQVQKIKNNKCHNSQQKTKQLNEISICIYRIQQQIQFY